MGCVCLFLLFNVRNRGSVLILTKRASSTVARDFAEFFGAIVLFQKQQPPEFSLDTRALT